MAGEDVRPDEKMKVTIEITGPKNKDELKKILDEIESIAKKYGFTTGKAKEKR